jgi:multicomponent Na+:H+ antiporter subunit B
MLKDFIILKTIISFIIPYALLYSFYIQINGEVSPGGGFQAGVIFASGVIAFDLLYGIKQTQQLLTTEMLTTGGVIGVMIYAGVGVISLIFNDNYLNYSSISSNSITGQHTGIFMIELGVGLTVASVMCLIYSLLQD